jgi:hypothetical protein
MGQGQRGSQLKRFSSLVGLLAVAAVVLAASASANHSWGGYHWARTANPFTIKLGDNVSGPWESMLQKASSDWTQSTVLDTQVVAGGTRPKSCRPTSGRVEVCSASYGNTGWLGVAQIWVSGGTHITQGTVKNNDYYFGSSSYQYNNTAEMQHVICQEIGHTFGLDHQSTDGSSLNTCMDYYHNTSSSDTKSTSPNAGDYDELLCIYDPASAGRTLSHGGHSCTGTGHLDSSSTIGAAAGQLPDAVPSFAPASRVAPSVYVDNLPNGDKLVTWVIWIDQARNR